MAQPFEGEFNEQRERGRLADRKSITVATTCLALIVTVVPFQPGWDRFLYGSIVLGVVVIYQLHWELRHANRVVLAFIGAILAVAVVGRLQSSAVGPTTDSAGGDSTTTTSPTPATSSQPSTSPSVSVQGKSITVDQQNQLEGCRAAIEIVAVAVRNSPLTGVALTSDGTNDELRQLEECQLRLAAIATLLPTPT